jgi:hypothetical protein
MTDQERIEFLEIQVRDLQEDLEQLKQAVREVRARFDRPARDVRSLLEETPLTALSPLETIEK